MNQSIIVLAGMGCAKFSPTKRKLILLGRLFVVGLSWALSFSLHAAERASAGGNPKRPNVLLILTDDQGYGDLRSTGNDKIDTPTIDRLATEGARFDRFHVSPVCAPTRAALISGHYPSRCGVYFTVGGSEIMRLKEVTIPQMLKPAGYATGLFGKWHNGEVYPYTPRARGFDEFLGFYGGDITLYFDPILEHNDKPVACKGYVADVLTDAAMEFMTAHRDGPFFCYVPFNLPHNPLQTPERLLQKYQKRGLDMFLSSIYGMVESIDENVARLLAKLDELKIADNTIVIFLSDNGPASKRFNAGMLGQKGGIDEGSTRVPCFVRWPGHIKPGTVIKPIAAHIDILPTIAEACGVKTPEGVKLDGRSLVPLLTGSKEPWPERTFFTDIGAARTDRWRIVFREAKGIQADNWPMWLAKSKIQLYDMPVDPGQEHDVAAEHPEVVKQLTDEFKAFKTDIGLHQKVPPLPVGYEQAPLVRLRTDVAKVKGVPNRGGYLGYRMPWADKEGSIEWNLDVVASGEYEARLVYVCRPEDLGAKVKLEACGNSIIATVDRPADPTPRQSSNPRYKVEDRNWATFPLGTLKLVKGQATMRMTVPEIPNKQAFEMVGIELERKGTAAGTAAQGAKLGKRNANWGVLASEIPD